MARYWTNEPLSGRAHEAPSRGARTDGGHVPSVTAGGRQALTSLLHDFMRTLLDLHLESALDRP